MTNGIAIGLIVLILGFFALDHYVLHLNAPVFLMQRMIDLIGWVAVWR